MGEDSKRCSEIVFVECRCAYSSDSENPSALVRSIEEGRVVGSVRSVSVSQARKSRTQRTEPARALITSMEALVERQDHF